MKKRALDGSERGIRRPPEFDNPRRRQLTGGQRVRMTRVAPLVAELDHREVHPGGQASSAGVPAFPAYLQLTGRPVDRGQARDTPALGVIDADPRPSRAPTQIATNSAEAASWKGCSGTPEHPLPVAGLGRSLYVSVRARCAGSSVPPKCGGSGSTRPRTPRSPIRSFHPSASCARRVAASPRAASE